MLASAGSFSAQWLTEYLGGKWNGRSGTAKCPAHPDDNPSMSITTGQKQNVVVHCFVCDQKDVVAKFQDMGVWPRPDRPWSPPAISPHLLNGHTEQSADDEIEWPELPSVTPIRRDVQVYEYRDVDGSVLFYKVRQEPKHFYQKQPDGTRNLDGVKKVLYRLPELLAAPRDATVFLCAGEKDTDRLISLGFVATTNYEGESGWKDEYTEFFRDRRVIILQDNDTAGEKRSARLTETLKSVAFQVRHLLLGDLPEGGDVSDWLDAGGTPDQLLLIAQEAFPYRFKLRTPDDIEKMEPPSYLADQWLVQNTLATLYGPSGVGKSFIVLDLLYSIASATEWLGSVQILKPGPVVYVAAEGVGGLQKRQRAWRACHPDADISSVRYVTVPVNMLENPEVNDLLDAIRAQCPDTPTCVALDTLARSMAGGDENSTKDMSAVIAAADRIKTALNCLVVLVHHTGKNGENERGSSALRGACDTMITISKEDSAIKMTLDKQKDGMDGISMGLKLVPVDGTESCVIDLFDATGEISQTARKLLRVLADHFPLDEGASTGTWHKVSGMKDDTFYRSRRLLEKGGFIVKEKKYAPNMITVIGCLDLDIEPSENTPGTTTNYYDTTTIVVDEVPKTTTTTGGSLDPRRSSSRTWWSGDGN